MLQHNADALRSALQARAGDRARQLSTTLATRARDEQAKVEATLTELATTIRREAFGEHGDQLQLISGLELDAGDAARSSATLGRNHRHLHLANRAVGRGADHAARVRHAARRAALLHRARRGGARRAAGGERRQPRSCRHSGGRGSRSMDRTRRELFVAMTRARDTVWVGYVAEPSVLLGFPDETSGSPQSSPKT